MTGSVYDQHDYFPQKRQALATLDAEIRRILRREGERTKVFRSLGSDEAPHMPDDPAYLPTSVRTGILT